MTTTTTNPAQALPTVDTGRAKAHLPANDLKRLLSTVLPHLDRNVAVPGLDGVELTVTPGRITVCGCDRYTLGAAFAEAQTTGTWRGVLPGAFAEAVNKAMPRARKHGTGDVFLDLDGSAVTVSPPPSPTGILTTLADITTGTGFVDWRALVAKALDAKTSPEPFALNPAKLPYWKHLAEFGPVHVLTTGPGKTVLLLAEQAIGMTSPLRYRAGDSRGPEALRNIWRNAVVPW